MQQLGSTCANFIRRRWQTDVWPSLRRLVGSFSIHSTESTNSGDKVIRCFNDWEIAHQYLFHLIAMFHGLVSLFCMYSGWLTSHLGLFDLSCLQLSASGGPYTSALQDGVAATPSVASTLCICTRVFEVRNCVQSSAWACRLKWV